MYTEIVKDLSEIKVEKLSDQIISQIKDLNSPGDDILYKSSWTDAEYYYFSKETGNDQFDLKIVAS